MGLVVRLLILHLRPSAHAMLRVWIQGPGPRRRCLVTWNCPAPVSMLPLLCLLPPAVLANQRSVL